MIQNYIPQLLVMLFLSNFLIAQTNVDNQLSTLITSDLTLTKNTTYIVPKNIELSNGAILNIEEGVILKSLNHTRVTIIINGGSKIVAYGSYDNPIKATTALITKEQPIIVMQSSQIQNKSAIETNYFYYKTIENPTLLISNAPKVNTIASSMDTDF
ncbi:hypothetical protein [uncultured Aquimarina sp.]|uniref:hypothetical protein n=1 Tax=uncultured Aquimarina sp. TaxID=575652 RepID=UPI00260FF96D|nr:hypothetical protein [uncultured Aquimarina sp.]